MCLATLNFCVVNNLRVLEQRPENSRARGRVKQTFLKLEGVKFLLLVKLPWIDRSLGTEQSETKHWDLLSFKQQRTTARTRKDILRLRHQCFVEAVIVEYSVLEKQ